jgi:hypothetical protein
MKKVLILLVLVLGFTLVACGPAKSGISSKPSVVSAKSQPTSTQVLSGSNDLIRTEDQGAVAFSVQPLNLDAPGDSLNFEVSMNTHSVDLTMNLATLATLTTDKGVSVSGLSWNGPAGGHHVSGVLTFSAKNAGKSILDGATKLTLTINNVDAPQRIFTWDLP